MDREDECAATRRRRARPGTSESGMGAGRPRRTMPQPVICSDSAACCAEEEAGAPDAPAAPDAASPPAVPAPPAAPTPSPRVGEGAGSARRPEALGDPPRLRGRRLDEDRPPEALTMRLLPVAEAPGVPPDVDGAPLAADSAVATTAAAAGTRRGAVVAPHANASPPSVTAKEARRPAATEMTCRDASAARATGAATYGRAM